MDNNENIKKMKTFEKVVVGSGILFVVLMFITLFVPAIANYTAIFLVILLIIVVVYAFKILVTVVKELSNKAPLILFITLLLMFFIVLPFLFIKPDGEHQFSDSVKTFYAIAVGVGINYVIDSAFKFVEPEFDNVQKNLLTSRASFTKMLFNIVYISEYLSFILADYYYHLPSKIQDQKNVIGSIVNFVNKQDSRVIFIIITVIIFLILLAFVTLFMNAIRREIESEVPNELSLIKSKIEGEIGLMNDMIEKVKSNNILNDLNKTKKNLEDELRRLNDTKK